MQDAAPPSGAGPAALQCAEVPIWETCGMVVTMCRTAESDQTDVACGTSPGKRTKSPREAVISSPAGPMLTFPPGDQTASSQRLTSIGEPYSVSRCATGTARASAIPVRPGSTF